MNIILVGFCVHIIFLVSVFDIYFHSPISNDIPSVKNTVAPLAKRLVLLVADGLRADTLFCDSDEIAPFLRNLMEGNSAWGISEAGVPTESRPGHVAIIAGLYEDPSAIFKGWQDNPVDFDSVFNQSFVTFAWGSPDIVPMFNRGIPEGKYYYDSYSADEQHFYGENKVNGCKNLSLWAYSKFVDLMNGKNPEMLQKARGSQTIFFLHLLGPDIAGHSFKPHSWTYDDNLMTVDNIARDVNRIMNEVFPDNKTAFILTSDHGMTDWGSHGAGTDDEILTPFIGWGSGFKKHKGKFEIHNASCSQFLKKDTIRQVDISVLMSILLGIPIPVNSVGLLPHMYLEMNEVTTSEALLVNFGQLMRQLLWRDEHLKCSLFSYFYFPYKNLNHLQYSLDTFMRINKKHSQLKNLVPLVHSMTKLTLSGIKYYVNYFQNFLLGVISITFLGWAGTVLCYIAKINSSSIQSLNMKHPRKFYIVLGFICMVLTFLIYAQSLPLRFLVYLFSAAYFWVTLIFQYHCYQFVTSFLKACWDNMFRILIYSVKLQMLVGTFYHREFSSLIMVLFALWPWMYNSNLRSSALYAYSWSISCLTLSVFPLLPTVGVYYSQALVLMCEVLWLFFGVTLVIYSKRIMDHNLFSVVITQVMILLSIIFNTLMVNLFKSVYFVNHIASWILLVLMLCTACCGSKDVFLRHLTISISLGTAFCLFSTAHEAFFVFFLMANLHCWMTLESKVQRVERRHSPSEVLITKRFLCADDVNTAFYFLTLINLSFFGIGNVASINSFDTEGVKLFLSVFSPFLMTGLLLLKIIIPFLLVTITMEFIVFLTKITASILFLIFVLFCDSIGLQFLFKVTNKGSWLQIGTSLSHFIIMETMVLFVLIFFFLAKFLTRQVTNPDVRQAQSKRFL